MMIGGRPILAVIAIVLYGMSGVALRPKAAALPQTTPCWRAGPPNQDNEMGSSLVERFISIRGRMLVREKSGKPLIQGGRGRVGRGSVWE